MATKNDTADGAQETGPLAVGTLVKLAGSDRYAILVGYTDPVAEHEEPHPNGGTVKVEAVPHGHPLLLDLHGSAREHQAGIERA